VEVEEKKAGAIRASRGPSCQYTLGAIASGPNTVVAQRLRFQHGRILRRAEPRTPKLRTSESVRGGSRSAADRAASLHHQGF